MQIEEPIESRAGQRPTTKPRLAEAEAPRPRAPDDAAPTKPGARRPWLILGLVVLVGLGGFGAYSLLTAGRESTDDAQVAADLLPVSARVGGLIQKVAIRENQAVQPGELIAQIDSAEYVAR
ncbi:MAG TPA: biotin/lipoyl-binding protein, partial [Polyangiaceae bacterium]|nr:biotin/lipoyl-binding protein [Polyangiaceae bacterium]